MTCDELFETLTSVPHVATPAVAEHLAGCARCRDLQEALFPGLSQIAAEPNRAHNQTAPEFRINWQTRPAPESVETALLSASRLSQPRSRNMAARRRSTSWRYIAAFLAGAAASLGAVAVLKSDPSIVPLNTSPVCLWTQTRDSEASPSNEVVVRCVACHLRGPAATALPNGPALEILDAAS